MAYVRTSSSKRRRTTSNFAGSDGPPEAREGGPPSSGPSPDSDRGKEVELVMMNGEVVATLKCDDLENVSTACFIEDLEQDMVRGVPGANADELGVMLERFTLVIGTEVMDPDDEFLVSDYYHFHEGEEPIRITLVKHPVEEAIYKEIRREAEVEHEELKRLMAF